MIAPLRCLLAALIATPFGSGPELVERFSQPFEPFHLTGNLYYVGSHEVTAFLIDTGEGLIVLDGGLPETGPMIAENMATLGFDVADITILLNSHAHFDHAGGLAYLQERSGAGVVAMRGDARALETGDAEFGAFPPVRVDRVIDDGDRVELGDTRLEALHTPGHTPGCTSWRLQVASEQGPLDAVFVCSMSALPQHRLVDNPAYPQIAADFERSFERLARLEADLFLGAHGSFFGLHRKAERLRAGEGITPFIDPDGLQRYVERKWANFHEELARQKLIAASEP